jgi:hypothetical protein
VVLVILDDLPPACGHLLTTSTSPAIILHPLDAPIEDIVVLVAFMNEKVTEELAQVRIVRFVVESERTSVVEARDSRSSWRACSTPRWVLIEV